MEFLARNSRTLKASFAGHGRGGESTYQVRVRVFSSEQIPVNLSARPNNTVDLPFSFYNEFIMNPPLVIEETHKHGLDL
jgi:hypothetical protein